MGRTLFYCADVKTRVSSFWGFTKRELSKNWVSPEPSVQSKIRLSCKLSKKIAMSSKWDSTFSFVKEHGFSFFFLSRVGKISFFYCQGFRKPPFFSVKTLENLSFGLSSTMGTVYTVYPTSTVLYVYPLGSTLKNKVTTSLR